MPQLPEVSGVIYPIPELTIKNLVSGKKNVFAKYTTHEPNKWTKIRVKEGDKLLFYQPQKNLSVVGEAEIIKYEWLTKLDILNRYAGKLSISKKDFDIYTQGRESKKLFVL